MMNATTEQTPPPDYPEFVVCAGRYYLGHWFIDLPKCAKIPQGGNVGALVWRYDSGVTKWYVTICFRYYRDEKAYDSEDVKNWKFFTVELPEAEMAKRILEVMHGFSGAAGLCFLSTPPKVFQFVVRGDWLKFRHEVAIQKPFWLHCPTPV